MRKLRRRLNHTKATISKQAVLVLSHNRSNPYNLRRQVNKAKLFRHATR